MAPRSDYIAGTISLENGSTAFTGSGTGWLAGGFQEGDTIIDVTGATEFMGVIASITTNGAGTLTKAWEGPDLSGVPYRMRYQPDNSRVQAQSRELIELLGNGNNLAFAQLEGFSNAVPVFTGPGVMSLINKSELVNGVMYDARVESLAARAAYDDRPGPTDDAPGFGVVVVVDGFATLYNKNSDANADWSAGADVTGGVGPAPDLADVNVTTLPAGSPGSGSFTETSPGVYELDLEIPAGADGVNGSDGTDPGILLTWDTGTSDTDPGAGKIRANNASIAAATMLYISKTNRVGGSIAAFLASLDDSTSTIKGKATITSEGNGPQSGAEVTGITDATGYVKVAISNPWGATTLTGAVSFQFERTGDAGTGAVSSVNGQSGVVVLTAPDVGAVPSDYLDTDGTLAANSDTKVPTQKAVKTYAQPLDSDLTAIAALTTTSYGRALLALADQAALMALLLAASTSGAGVSEFATAAEYRTGTNNALSLVVNEVWAAAQLAALTDGTNIAVDFAAGFNFGGASNAVLGLGGNRTLDAPSNLKTGQSGVLWFGAVTSTRTLTLNAAWLLLDGVEAGPYSITTAQELGVAYTIRNTRVYVTAIMRRAA